MAKTETKKMLAAAVAAAQDKQAVDLRVLELDPAESSLTDFFLVMSGTNARQIQTLADEIELRLKREFGQMPNSREGYRQAEWILLDYVDFVVHIFSEEKRAYYGIERLRKSAIGRDPASLRADSGKAVSKKAVGKKTVSGKSVSKKAIGRKAVGKKAVGSKARPKAAKKSAKKAAPSRRKRG
jgi:ribosome-associated protein